MPKFFCRSGRTPAVLAGLLTLGLGTGDASAQTVPPATAPAGDTAVAPTDTTQLADIVVTANKRNENLQRASIAATVVTTEQLAQRDIVDVVSIQKIAPSIKLTAVRQQAQIYIRGIGSAFSGSNADPAVAVNANGVYIPSELSAAAFFDLERVEVLPGPQGTLYGRNASGGVVNVLTRRPGNQFGGNAYIDGGNYNELETFAAVDLPASDQLAFRIAGFEQRHDDYIKGLNNSGLGNADRYGGRLSALFTPSTATTVFATATVVKSTGTVDGSQNNPPVGGDYWSIPVDIRAAGIYDDYTNQIYSGQIDQKLTSNITLTYILGHARLDGSERVLVQNTGPVTVLTFQKVRSTTNELRLTGDTDRLKWLAGAYLYDADANSSVQTFRPPSTAVLLLGPYAQQSHGYAFFGQATYSLTDTLRLVGGLRYSWDKKSLSGTNGTLLATGVVTGATAYAGSRDDSRLDYKGGVEFDVAPDSLMYASIQSGYNQGGFSTDVIAPGSTTAAPYAPATLVAYTIGSKNRFFDRRLQVNVEAFYYDYKNYQVSSRNLVTGQNNVYNAQKARTYGVQVDTSLKITRHDTLSASLALLDGKETTLTISPTLNFSGLALPFSPDATVIGDYTHSWELAHGAALDLEGSVRYVSGLFATYSHAAGTFQPANTKIDLSLTYRPPSNHWSLQAYVRNVTNEAVFGILNSPAFPGPGSGILEAPRTFGARVSVNF